MLGKRSQSTGWQKVEQQNGMAQHDPDNDSLMNSVHTLAALTASILPLAFSPKHS